jgi:hypothetical protein
MTILAAKTDPPLRPRFGLAPALLSLAVALLWLTTAGLALAATVTAMEYYIDSDPGRGLATPIPPVDGAYDSVEETGRVTVATSTLKVGPHMVYVRAKSSTGVWGTYPPVLLCIYDRPTVAAAEYYIDTDPGQGNAIPLQPVDGVFGSVQELITATTVPTSGLAMGNHTLGLRARNSRGLWGPTRAIPFEVLRTRFIAGADCGLGGAADTAPTGAIYAMDAVNLPFDSSVEDVIKTGLKAPSQVGVYRAFVRTRDSLSLTSAWSYAEFRVATNGYYIWAGDYGLSGADALPDANPAGDGIMNAVKYACNMNPTLAGAVSLPPGTGASGLPNSSLTGTSESRRLRLEYLRRKDTNSITYQVFFTSTLSPPAGWQPATGSETVTAMNPTWERVTIYDAAATGSEPARFGTVQITLKP